ncbi:MAG: peptidoglycan-binding protein [Hyphomicrobiales bacterium]|nr:peptidoglycan-binding protein [Hyphomicrobiales bacterium]
MSMTMSARAHHSHHVSRRPSSHATPWAWFARRLRHRPGSTLAHTAFGLVALAVIINAVAFQRVPESRSFLAEQSAGQARAAVVPLPPQRPAELALPAPQRSQPVPPQSVPVQTAQAPVTAPAARVQPAREAPSRDPIGDLIRTGQVSDAPRPPAGLIERAALAETRPVLAAQRALNRVGAGPVKADGVFGEETRAAIERFERERRLPVTRDLGARTLRELASASGLRME